MQSPSVKANTKLIDKKKVKTIIIELGKSTDPWLKEVQRILKKHMKDNPVELSEAMTSLIRVMLKIFTPNPKDLCIELAHSYMREGFRNIENKQDMHDLKKDMKPDYFG